MDFFQSPFQKHLNKGEYTGCLKSLIEFCVKDAPLVLIRQIVFYKLIFASWSNVNIKFICRNSILQGKARKENLRVTVTVFHRSGCFYYGRYVFHILGLYKDCKIFSTNTGPFKRPVIGLSLNVLAKTLVIVEFKDFPYLVAVFLAVKVGAYLRRSADCVCCSVNIKFPCSVKRLYRNIKFKDIIIFLK